MYKASNEQLISRSLVAAAAWFWPDSQEEASRRRIVVESTSCSFTLKSTLMSSALGRDNHHFRTQSDELSMNQTSRVEYENSP